MKNWVVLFLLFSPYVKAETSWETHDRIATGIYILAQTQFTLEEVLVAQTKETNLTSRLVNHVNFLRETRTQWQLQLNEIVIKAAEAQGLTVLGLVDPCGPNPYGWDEMLVKVQWGPTRQHYRFLGGKKLQALPLGTYTTKDSMACRFIVKDGEIVWEGK